LLTRQADTAEFYKRVRIEQGITAQLANAASSVLYRHLAPLAHHAPRCPASAFTDTTGRLKGAFGFGEVAYPPHNRLQWGFGLRVTGHIQWGFGYTFAFKFNYTFALPGTYKIKAVYNGDSDFLSSSSSVLTETIS
jgi:hypothetical protein